MLQDNKLAHNNKALAITVPAGDDTEQTSSWWEMTNFGSIMVEFIMTVAGGTGLKTLSIVMGDTSDGTGNVETVATKTIATADPGLIDAVGDHVFLEVSAENIQQALLDAEMNDKGFKWAAFRWTLDTAAEATAAGIQGMSRYSGVTEDFIA